MRHVASDGHEAGSLSSWVQALGLPVVCLETRHVRAAMAAQRNNANDALGIARIMRTGCFRSAHMKQIKLPGCGGRAVDPAPQPQAQVSRH